MTEQHSEQTETGHPAVDEVLRSLADLPEDTPAEHVAAFERAHESLRSALSGAHQPAVTDTSEPGDGRERG